MHVVATAGHVDHGKSTLVHALTGMDPDRLAEEKRRGLTVDLGFAWTTLPSGRDIAIVDVPGHVRFLSNMLAGVGAVRACIFVVAATEGWMPQSEEHLRILDVLGVRHGVVVLSKAEVADAARREAVRCQVRERMATSTLADAEVVEADARQGTGLDEVRHALDRLLDRTPAPVDGGRPRLWVDRAFTMRGAGTVVTGTLAGGSLRVGETVALFPSGARARVRGLQSHGVPVECAASGRRVAVNLSGVGADEVARGAALVHPGQWEAATVVDCALDVLPSLGHPVSRRGAFHAYLGSGEHPVALRVLGRDAIEPGHGGLVRLHLPEPVPLLPGDRYVLRDRGRSETVGGGEVLDVAPVLPASRAKPTISVDRVVAERGWVEVDLLERLTGERRPPTVGRWVVADEEWAAAVERVRATVAAAGPPGLDVARLDERGRAVLAQVHDVVVADGRARSAVAEDAFARHPYVAALEAALFTPPAPDDVEPPVLRGLVRRGVVVERDGIYFAPAAVAEATGIVTRLLDASPDGVSVSTARAALGTTRKYAMPLLALLDARGVTRRCGEVRVRGGG